MSQFPANKKAICAGSFDPPSYGHINMIERALKLFDKIIIAIGADHTKSTLFTSEERASILKQIFAKEPRVEVDFFEGLLVNYAKGKECKILVRGIRTISDYEYELQMSLANRTLDPEIETIFMMTEGRYSHISSSIIKQVIQLGGSGKHMIHPFVEEKIKEKLLLNT